VNTDYISKESDGEIQNTAHKDMSSIYQEQKVQPCQLSSSIHYGGQDIYSRPMNTQDSGFNSMVITVTIVCIYIVIFRAYNKRPEYICEYENNHVLLTQIKCNYLVKLIPLYSLRQFEISNQE